MSIMSTCSLLPVRQCHIQMAYILVGARDDSYDGTYHSRGQFLWNPGPIMCNVLHRMKPFGMYHSAFTRAAAS